MRNFDHILMQVTENSTVVYSTSTKRPATRLSFAEVLCPLDINDTLRYITNPSRHHDTYIARGYAISITNDGLHFGDSDSIVIFNSSCVNCTKTGNQIACLRDVSLYNIHCVAQFYDEHYPFVYFRFSI